MADTIRPNGHRKETNNAKRNKLTGGVTEEAPFGLLRRLYGADVGYYPTKLTKQMPNPIRHNKRKQQRQDIIREIDALERCATIENIDA